MSSSNGSTADRSESQSERHYCGNGDRGANWSCLNIAAMVLGFIVFWPIGLLILYTNIRGYSVKELPRVARRKWSGMKEGWGSDGGDTSDNVVFNEFQQAQYDRIREIKEEIRERARRFSDFRERARRRADEEEFNRFMAEAPVQNDG